MTKIFALLLLAQPSSMGQPIGDYRVSSGGGSPTFAGGITAGAGMEATGAGTCSGTDSVVHDNNGVAGCQKLSDVAPQGLMLRPQPAFAGGTQTASDLNLCAGQDESKVAIDNNANCNAADTVTVAVINSNASKTTTVLTYGTDWCTGTCNTDALVCASLAAAIDALAGVGATCTSPNVLITLDLPTCAVALAESDATCTTVATGTSGVINLRGASTSTMPNLAVGSGGGLTVNAAAGITLGNSTAVSSTLTGSSTITSTATGTIGWSVVAGANTACTTTCTNACVVGFDTGLGGSDLVDCADATADRCLCAGAN